MRTVEGHLGPDPRCPLPDGWEPFAVPTPEQAAAVLDPTSCLWCRACRLAYVTALLEDSQRAGRCVLMNHDAYGDQVERLRARVKHLEHQVDTR